MYMYVLHNCFRHYSLQQYILCMYNGQELKNFQYLAVQMVLLFLVNYGVGIKTVDKVYCPHTKLLADDHILQYDNIILCHRQQESHKISIIMQYS